MLLLKRWNDNVQMGKDDYEVKEDEKTNPERREESKRKTVAMLEG